MAISAKAQQQLRTIDPLQDLEVYGVDIYAKLYLYKMQFLS